MVEPVYQSCMDAACRYLSYRPRSEKEIKIRLLRRGFDNPCIEIVLKKLREQALIDDLAFARFWSDNRESFSPRGRVLLRKELKDKGIAPDIIDEVLDGLDEESSAYRAAQRKMKAFASSDFKDFQHKLGAFLKRRGFSYTITNNTVNQLWLEMGE